MPETPPSASKIFWDWVDQRLDLWTHVHAKGVLLWNETRWINTGCLFTLCDGHGRECSPEPEVDLDPSWPGELCGFQTRLQPDLLWDLISGIEAGFLGGAAIPGIEDEIVFNVNRQIVPNGLPRLEPPAMASLSAVMPWMQWPRYSLELQSGSLADLFGATFHQRLEIIDSRLASEGYGTISELSVRLGIRTNDEHYSTFNSTATTVRFVAPVYVRGSDPHWKHSSQTFVCSAHVGPSVPREKVSFVLAESHRKHVPAQPAFDNVSPTEVRLSTQRPSYGAVVRVFYLGQKLQEFPARLDFEDTMAAGLPALVDRTVYDVGQSRIQASLSEATTSDVLLPEPGEWQVLGRGGFGAVYAVRDELTQVEFAIKIFDPSPLVASPDAKKRFLREAGLLFRLNHASIIRVFHAGTLSSGDLFIRMERFNGDSLQAFLAGRSVTVSESVEIISRLASALEHAHAQKIFHRDLKPTNVLVSPTLNEIRLIDFGLGILVEEIVSQSRLTKSTAGFGDVYSAPELLEDPRILSPATDVYSLGAIWYRLIVGLAPRGTGVEGSIESSDLHPEHKSLLRRCLANSGNRPSMSELVGRLRGGSVLP